MADTIRELNALLTTLFQDGQPPSSISAQDVRDALVSLFAEYRKGGAAGWRDLIGLISQADKTIANPPSKVLFKDNGAGSFGVLADSFSATVEQEVLVTFALNHDFLEGTTLYPFVRWSPSSANSGTVRWGIEWTAAGRYDVDTFPNTTFTYLEQAAGGDRLFQTIEGAGITIPNARPGTIIIARVFRAATHANDTYADGAFCLAVGGHYQTDHHATKNRAPDFYA